jgi:hypothetical protein
VNPNLTSFRQAFEFDGVDHEDNAINGGEVVLPQATRSQVTAQICTRDPKR